MGSIYSRNKFKEGQVVKLDDVKGTITRIDNVSVTIQSEDTTVILPMQLFQSKKVEIF
ncbi:mechanosensitive ion channel domain-containing protein [Aphanothece microscopica]|uniref:mechanosensitive ion channel domain-containing protein n=1 Tax=Aphanothece microscopica TaxID=1049561 RepID=UPI003984D446